MTEKLNLYQRLTKLRGMVFKVAADKKVQGAGGYEYASHDAVMEAIRSKMIECGIVSYTSIKDIQNYTAAVEATRNNQSFAKSYSLVRVFVQLTVVNQDNPEERIIVDAVGDGEARMGSADKAVGAAMSYAKKYAYRLLLDLATGEDTDMHTSERQTSHADHAAPAPQPIQIKASPLTGLSREELIAEIGELCKWVKGWTVERVCERKKVSSLHAIEIDDLRAVAGYLTNLANASK